MSTHGPVDRVTHRLPFCTISAMRRKADPIPPMPSVEEHIEAVRADSWRVFCEHQRARNAVDQQWWFPWVVIAVGAGAGAGLMAVLTWFKG